MMMLNNVEVISREIIKPSSPTPQNLRNLKLSFLDQLANRIYIPIVFFYDHPESNSHINDLSQSYCLLKKSLAECLTLFYPLAGTMRDEDFTIDCDDEGIEFLETRIGCELSKATENPVSDVLSQFLPFDSYGASQTGDKSREVLLGVQFNIFKCGGVAIGVCISHKIADGTSLATFLTSWAAISRERGITSSTVETKHPIFDASLIFPPRDLPAGFKRETEMRAGSSVKIVTRRFVFDKSKIIALRDKISPRATRVQAVSALIWQRFMTVIRSKSTSGKVCVAIHAVNLRERMVPQLANNFFGNLWRNASASTTIESEKDLNTLASLIGNATSAINHDYVKDQLQNNYGYDEVNSFTKAREQLFKGEIEFFGFSSWLRFPLYEVDFGWGKPTWLCSPISPYKNLAILMSTRDGDGIEACINLLEEDMALFERDPELLSFVSFVK